jgi:DNA-3-methyladenine glycosylase II
VTGLPPATTPTRPPEDPVALLAAAEPAFARALELAGPPAPLPVRPPGFGTLLKIILEQQVSITAAEAMWRKLDVACRPLTPDAFLRLDDGTLRACGFSRQKAAYGRALALDLAEGRLDLDAVHAAPDDEAGAMLVRLKGIGRWSAEIYLMFALGRPDVWPADDLGIQVGLQEVLGLAERPRRDAADLLAEPWRPLRTTAARMVWHAYLWRRRRSPPV